MRKKLTVGIIAAAIAAAPFTAAPAQASPPAICDIWAPPLGAPCYIVMRVLCGEPFPPFTICR